MPIKLNTKKTTFSIYSTKLFLKGSLQVNHWVWKSVMKPVDDMVFQNIKLMRGGNNDESNNFDKVIIDEDALDKFLTFPENFQLKNPGRKFMRSLTMNTSNNQMLSFQNIFY